MVLPCCTSCISTRRACGLARDRSYRREGASLVSSIIIKQQNWRTGRSLHAFLDPLQCCGKAPTPLIPQSVTETVLTLNWVANGKHSVRMSSERSALQWSQSGRLQEDIPNASPPSR